MYNGFCKILRKAYFWSPLIVDRIEVYRILKIIEEIEQDGEENK